MIELCTCGRAEIQRGRSGRDSGFTLLEVLVASLLLGMLVTILTMVFNQSSIAWRIGKAGVADLDETRRKMSLYQKAADDALPFVAENSRTAVGRVLGAWDPSRSGASALRKRAVEPANMTFPALSRTTPLPWQLMNVKGATGAQSFKSYRVDVSSAGPDRKWGTDDDISSGKFQK